MSKLYLILTISFGFCYTSTFSQQKDPIEADRPDQTETPAIVPKGMFQMENGFSFEKASRDSKSFVIPSSLIKYGINDNFELRLITEFITDKTEGAKISGLAPVLVGFKVGVTEEHGIIPKTSLIAHLLIPDLASKKLKATYYAPEFRFTMQHTLMDKVNLSYNLGAEWDGEFAEPTFIYTLTGGFSIAEDTGFYIEVYGFAPQYEEADHRFDTGFTQLLSDNFMIDISGGVGITENAPDYFAALGFSFRI